MSDIKGYAAAQRAYDAMEAPEPEPDAREDEDDGAECHVNSLDYHAHPALGSSRLRELTGSSTPAHFRANIRRETAALNFGTLVHTLVLEPDTFDARYLVVPKINGATKEGKAQKAALSSETRTVINEEVMAEARACAESVMAHTVYRWIRDAQVEQTVFWDETVTWQDEHGETITMVIPCKARFDVVGPWLTDLKTTRDASPKGFSRSIAQYGYHIQGAHYIAGARANGLEPKGFLFACVETEAPYLTAGYMLGDASLAQGEAERQEALLLYARCLHEDRWPGYNNDRIDVIDLPFWAQRSE